MDKNIAFPKSNAEIVRHTFKKKRDPRSSYHILQINLIWITYVDEKPKTFKRRYRWKPSWFWIRQRYYR